MGNLPAVHCNLHSFEHVQLLVGDSRGWSCLGDVSVGAGVGCKSGLMKPAVKKHSGFRLVEGSPESERKVSFS